MKRRRGSSSRGRSQVGPRIVRAWFDTVVNPLLHWLEREQYLLASRNWTWRFKPASLESTREVRAYVDRETWPNLEQFEELHPDVGRVAAAHDERLLALTQDCRLLHKAPVTSGDFRAMFSF